MNTALVFDNDIRHRNFIIKLLTERLFFGAEYLDQATKIIEKIDELQPEVIFLDVSRPKMEGLFALEAIRRSDNYKEMPVVVMSTISDKEVLTKLIKLGITDFIIKQYDLRNTLEKLRKVITPYKIKAAKESGLNKKADPKKETDDKIVNFVTQKREKVRHEIETAIWKSFRGIANDEIKLAKLQGIKIDNENVFSYVKNFAAIDGEPVHLGLFCAEQGVRKIAGKMQGGGVMKIEDGALDVFKELVEDIANNIKEIFEMQEVPVKNTSVSMKRNLENIPNDTWRESIYFVSSQGDFFIFGLIGNPPKKDG